MENEFYHYEVDEDQKVSFIDLIEKVPDGFHYYERAFGKGKIHYKTEASRVIEVVFEDDSGRKYADEKVLEFVGNLFL